MKTVLLLQVEFMISNTFYIFLEIHFSNNILKYENSNNYFKNT